MHEWCRETLGTFISASKGKLLEVSRYGAFE